MLDFLIKKKSSGSIIVFYTLLLLFGQIDFAMISLGIDMYV